VHALRRADRQCRSTSPVSTRRSAKNNDGGVDHRVNSAVACAAYRVVASVVAVGRHVNDAAVRLQQVDKRQKVVSVVSALCSMQLLTSRERTDASAARSSYLVQRVWLHIGSGDDDHAAPKERAEQPRHDDGVDDVSDLPDYARKTPSSAAP
jgi:hypothetical protein